MTHQWHKAFVEATRTVRTWQKVYFKADRDSPDKHEALVESRKAERRLDQLIEMYDREKAGEPGLGL